MLNRYPLWKYIVIICVMMVAALYALPNLYGEDPALQISGMRGANVTTEHVSLIRQTLESKGIATKSVELEEGQVLVRFKDTDTQLGARELLSDTLGEGYIVALNLAPATPAWLEQFGAEPLKLGLDLRGGVHFLMEVDTEQALQKSLVQSAQGVREQLKEANIRYRGVQTGTDKVSVMFSSKDEWKKAYDKLRRSNTDLVFSDREQGATWFVDAVLSEARIKEIKKYAVSQNIITIRNRVNELGVSEPVVQQQGLNRIVVELPGIQDTARAKELLGATATVEFHLQDTSADLEAAVQGRVPPGSKLYPSHKGYPVVLKKRVILTGDHIVDAQSGFSEYNLPQVTIRLDSAGGSKMSNFTKDHIGQPMATLFIEFKPEGEPDETGRRQFVKDEEVISVATIQSRLGNSFQITGIGSMAEAHNLALLLRAGALIAPIQIIEERTIGPSLGQQNIESGLQAMIYGMLCVMLFMAVYYRKFGLIANVALLANLILIVGLMSMIPGATMTLPGIAGIVLTVGMAVDANVLIFERIREELRAGRSVQHAINQGYARAFATIADSNITTLITAFILFAVGTGPIKGFAITLAIGIVASMFTAITGTRAIVNLIWGGNKRVEELPI